MAGSQAEELREFYIALHDLLVNSLGLFIVIEGRVASQQLVYKNANSPIIDSLSISIFVGFVKHLGGQILRCTTDGKCPLPMEFLSKTHIDQLRGSLRINHNILRLQIPKHDVPLMQVRDSIQNAGHIEESHVIAESSIFCQTSEQLASLNVLKQHEDMFAVLECGLSSVMDWVTG